MARSPSEASFSAHRPSRYVRDDVLREEIAPHLSRLAFAALVGVLEREEGFPKIDPLFKGRYLACRLRTSGRTRGAAKDRPPDGLVASRSGAALLARWHDRLALRRLRAPSAEPDSRYQAKHGRKLYRQFQGDPRDGGEACGARAGANRRERLVRQMARAGEARGRRAHQAGPCALHPTANGSARSPAKRRFQTPSGTWTRAPARSPKPSNPAPTSPQCSVARPTPARP